MAERRCAMCTHVHECTFDRDVRAWLCVDCFAYVEDDNPWSATEMCTAGMTNNDGDVR